MEKLKTSNTGIIQGLLAYDGDEQVGSGWVVFNEYFCQEITLIATDGGALPEGAYIIVPSKEIYLTVLNRSVH